MSTRDRGNVTHPHCSVAGNAFIRVGKFVTIVEFHLTVYCKLPMTKKYRYAQ